MSDSHLGGNLTGDWRVRTLLAAVKDARRLLPRTKDRMILRRHALKLRFWPEKHPTSESGLVLDVDWSWIRSLPGLNVGELRIDDKIGGFGNLRLIFFVGDPVVKDPLPMIWSLLVMDKKRQDFTVANLKVMKARRQIVIERFYG